MKKLIVILVVLGLVLVYDVSLKAQGLNTPETTPGTTRAFSMYESISNYRDEDGTHTTRDFLATVNTRQNTIDYDFTQKASNGVINMATFWTDVPRKIGDVTEEDDLLAGCTIGLGEGLAWSAARGISGIYEAATFPIYANEEPLMKPAYKVSNPEKEGFKIKLLQW